ncbi:hypothetical protein HYH02_015371 [Chlamydomonas schloesseri]|uniref:Uncharacterized protein n=1 Tax=Chlamydomonas schloesseri TaxID=2026947 RepID=A0A835VRD9_9CHLO|nr:hypothetical protein HYH02_015371 [Chlamydomonas schloesseri]|eukprot:KAG2423028.1 hypothetical protein HYH02_015371 [Chlamydomonas schloesseri]
MPEDRVDDQPEEAVEFSPDMQKVFDALVKKLGGRHTSAGPSEASCENNVKVLAATARSSAGALPQLLCDFSFTDRQVGIKDYFHFTRTLRTEMEVVLAVVGMNDPEVLRTSSEMITLVQSLEYMKKLLDLRLAAIRGAMGCWDGRKLEIAAGYYELLAPKARKTEGKWATGEKEFWEVHPEIVDQARKKLPPPPSDRGNPWADGGRGGRGRGRGRSAGRGAGRGDAATAGAAAGSAHLPVVAWLPWGSRASA